MGGLGDTVIAVLSLGQSKPLHTRLNVAPRLATPHGSCTDPAADAQRAERRSARLGARLGARNARFDRPSGLWAERAPRTNAGCAWFGFGGEHCTQLAAGSARGSVWGRALVGSRARAA